MYGTKGFSIIGFPCDQFNLQEPGHNGTEIMHGIKYVRPGGEFIPAFQMFKKIDVNGASEEPLYVYLKKYCPQTQNVFEANLFYSPMRIGDVSWNYETFLVNKLGVVAKRYNPNVDPMELKADIESLLSMETGASNAHVRHEINVVNDEDFNKISVY